MLDPSKKFPTLEESARETQRRLDICAPLRKTISTFAETLILCGSLAYGKNYSVRTDSDIDLLIFLKPKKIMGIFDSELTDHNEWNDFAAMAFERNSAQHFTLRQNIGGVKVEYHLWNADYARPCAQLQIQSVKRLTQNPISSSSIHFDFFGTQRNNQRNVEKYDTGYLQDYPIYEILEGHFVPYDPIINLIMAPEILFTKNMEAQENIDTIWKKLAERLIHESGGEINLQRASIAKSQPPFAYAPPHIQKMIENRTIKELADIRKKDAV